MVQSDGQGVCACDAGGGLDEGPGQRRGGGGGWAKHRAVRGQAERYLAELSTALREGSYQPQPVRRVEIPKGDGKTRPLGIPTVKDRIVQTAVKFVIEPIFEATFRPTSYGFRPGRGCQDALREVDRLIEEGYTFVVDADLESYFDTHPARAADAAGRGARSAMGAVLACCAAGSARTSCRAWSDGRRRRARRKAR